MDQSRCLRSYGTPSFHNFRELLSSTGHTSGGPVLGCVFGCPSVAISLWCGWAHCPTQTSQFLEQQRPGQATSHCPCSRHVNPENASDANEWLTVVSGLDLLLLYSRLPLTAQFPETLDSSSVKWRLIIGLTLYEK